MFIFEVGSTSLFSLGIDAKQDAWIVILVALIIGLAFIWIYTELQTNYPDKNYIEIIFLILGNKLGIPLALLYAVYWFWPAARNLREFGELIIITTLPNTPLYIVLSIFICVSLYSIYKGIEVLARTSEIIMPIIICFMFALYILIALSKQLDLSKLKPIAADGLMPILKSAYPNVSLFPFGEIFIFSMFWKYSNDIKIVRKATMLAASISGIMLTFSLIMDVCTLGVKYTSISTIPLVEVIRLVNISNAITNIDALGVMVIFFGGFYKMTLFLYGSILVVSTVFRMVNYNFIVISLTILLLYVSIIFEPSYVFHKWMTPFDTNYFYITFLQIIPTLLLIINWLKKKRSEI
jgi:spore germination protein (amino acid permease)